MKCVCVCVCGGRGVCTRWARGFGNSAQMQHQSSQDRRFEHAMGSQALGARGCKQCCACLKLRESASRLLNIARQHAHLHSAPTSNIFASVQHAQCFPQHYLCVSPSVAASNLLRLSLKWSNSCSNSHASSHICRQQQKKGVNRVQGSAADATTHRKDAW